ncbi:MAG: DUF3597 domain-containing protein [Anaerolineales bacterium]|nr:DUF3597 domain-containing protein [Anaerolineales bacterium]
MSLFSKILGKLGLKKPEAESASATTGKKDVKPAPAARPAPSARPVSSSKPASTARPADTYRPVSSTPTPAPMAMVDVMSKLETMAKGTNLDWKVSIVDLLKVLGLESSLEDRKELAVELGCPADVMKDNVKMNVWLHKTVLAEIAKNGGNIPKELLD